MCVLVGWLGGCLDCEANREIDGRGRAVMTTMGRGSDQQVSEVLDPDLRPSSPTVLQQNLWGVETAQKARLENQD